MNIISALGNSPIKLGFVPLNDSAPLAVAVDMGLFKKYGVDVVASRQLGWASMRDMLSNEQLDAGIAIAGLALSLSLGIQSQKSDVVIPMYVSSEGNSVIISSKITHQNSSKKIGETVIDYHRTALRSTRSLRFAATHVSSSHHYLLLQWLKQAGLDSYRNNIEIVFLPSAIMADTLRSGMIDGYCAGEPWSSISVAEGVGSQIASSSTLSYGHPEKALICSARLIHERKEEATLICAALLEACSMCQSDDFFDDMIAILSKSTYLGISKDTLRASFYHSHSLSSEYRQRSCQFYGGDVNCPDKSKTSWLLSTFRTTHLLDDKSVGAMTKVFREDIYQYAHNLHKPVLCCAS